MNTGTLSNRQATVRNADEFREALHVLNNAAVGVVLCRTREPERAKEAIRSFAFSRDLEFGNWTPMYGWEKYSRTDPAADPETDQVADPIAALKKLGGLDGSEGFKNGFYTVTYPHFWMKENVGQRVPLIYILRDYVRALSTTKRRMILLAPPATTLPSEIAEDVVVLDFEAPSYAELSDTLTALMQSFSKRPRMTKEDAERIVSAGMGMTQHEFETAVSRAVIVYRHQMPNVDIDGLVEEVMKVKTEVVKRSEVLEVMPAGSMSQVGGLDNLKDWVSKRARCFSQEARDFGVEAPKGCGMFGPPGTGKSLSAKAIAHTLGLPLIKFDVSRVFQSLVGQSEERVRAALKMLDAMAPCVVLLDEIDKAFQRSSGGDSGVSQRILGAILTHMQESSAPIFWVFSANRVDNLPPELLRKGRLDEIFAVTVPDDSERLDILKIHLSKRRQNPDAIKDLNVAAAACEGYVPAEIEQAVKDALIESFTSGAPVTGAMIAEQFANIKPLSEAFAEDFRSMQEWAENNARPASSSIKRRKEAALGAVRPRSRTRAQRTVNMGD